LDVIIFFFFIIYMSDRFWFDDPSVLYRDQRYTQFIPTKSMTFNEKLNAIARFILYFAAIVFLIYGAAKIIMLLLIGLLLLYVANRWDPLGMRESPVVERFKSDECCLQMTEAMREQTDEKCQKPTEDNPFMNVMVTDYSNNPERHEACGDADNINDMNNMFSKNLYRNVNDVWDRGNGQLIFNTQNSTTIPNDRDAFQKWLYSVPYVCKGGDSEACYRGSELQLGNMRPGQIF
jgi:hypothetical protein